MRGLVSLQMSFLSECLFTNGAGEGSNVLVHSHVDCEVVGFGEHFPTNLTIFKLPATRFVI